LHASTHASTHGTLLDLELELELDVVPYLQFRQHMSTLLLNLLSATPSHPSTLPPILVPLPSLPSSTLLLPALLPKVRVRPRQPVHVCLVCCNVAVELVDGNTPRVSRGGIPVLILEAIVYRFDYTVGLLFRLRQYVHLQTLGDLEG